MRRKEQALQIQCVAWFRATYPGEVLVLIDNNARSINAGKLKKAMGCYAGFPDLFLFSKCDQNGGLGIELKDKGKKATPAQRKVHLTLESKGYAVAVIDSLEGFKRLIGGYLGG